MIMPNKHNPLKPSKTPYILNIRTNQLPSHTSPLELRHDNNGVNRNRLPGGISTDHRAVGECVCLGAW